MTGSGDDIAEKIADAWKRAAEEMENKRPELALEILTEAQRIAVRPHDIKDLYSARREIADKLGLRIK